LSLAEQQLQYDNAYCSVHNLFIHMKIMLHFSSQMQCPDAGLSLIKKLNKYLDVRAQSGQMTKILYRSMEVNGPHHYRLVR